MRIGIMRPQASTTQLLTRHALHRPSVPKYWHQPSSLKNCISESRQNRMERISKIVQQEVFDAVKFDRCISHRCCVWRARSEWQTDASILEHRVFTWYICVQKTPYCSVYPCGYGSLKPADAPIDQSKLPCGWIQYIVCQFLCLSG